MTDTEAEQVAETPRTYPDGDYAIVEIMGHTTLVGRFAEVERFGTKMLAIEPLFAGQFLPVVLHGGASIYRLTQVSAETAFREQPTRSYQLPPAIKANVPAALLEAETSASRTAWEDVGAWRREAAEAEADSDPDDDISF